MPRPDRHARPTRPSCLSNPLPLGLDLSLSLSLSLGLGLGPMSYGHTKWMSIREHIQVARVPRIIHLMFQKFIEEAYERHLNLLLKGIWKVYLIEEAYERHLRGIYLIEETYERHISLSRHLRGIWEAYLIEKTSERHLRGISHWGDIWEASEKHISLDKIFTQNDQISKIHVQHIQGRHFLRAKKPCRNAPQPLKGVDKLKTET